MLAESGSVKPQIGHANEPKLTKSENISPLKYVLDSNYCMPFCFVLCMPHCRFHLCIVSALIALKKWMFLKVVHFLLPSCCLKQDFNIVSSFAFVLFIIELNW